jgi:hypothetical protein
MMEVATEIRNSVIATSDEFNSINHLYSYTTSNNAKNSSIKASSQSTSSSTIYDSRSSGPNPIFSKPKWYIQSKPDNFATFTC